MVQSDADRQRAFRARRDEKIRKLEARVVELEQALAEKSVGHKACDALERELRAQIEQLRSRAVTV